MGLSASQARQLLLTAKRNDLEFRAQQISQQRLILSSQLEEIATEYENATSNRQMQMALYLTNGSSNDTVEKTTENLTYATLTSGCSRLSAGPLAFNSEVEYAATQAFVLKDADGRIVVSSVDEIPGYKEWQEQGNSTNETKSLKPGYIESDGKFYRKYDKEKDKDVTADNKLVYDDNKDEYTKYIEGDHKDKTVYVEVDENEAYNKITKEISLVEGGGPNKSDTYKIATTNADGKIIYDEYVVDPMLALGETDAYGSKSGPNYIQECLRNGLYLLEKWTPTNTGDIKRTSVSWDAATGISDRYYTEDDDAAKAKYDRLQNEIQRQDKKLELELDNIETQRSAITTEEESVQTVMDDNIEGTFKTFA